MIGFVYAVVWTPLGQAHRAKAKDTYNEAQSSIRFTES